MLQKQYFCLGPIGIILLSFLILLSFSLILKIERRNKCILVNSVSRNNFLFSITLSDWVHFPLVRVWTQSPVPQSILHHRNQPVSAARYDTLKLFAMLWGPAQNNYIDTSVFKQNKNYWGKLSKLNFYNNKNQ